MWTWQGPSWDNIFLIIVDALSKKLEDISMSVTTAETTVRKMQKIFAVHGLPYQFVSDNRAQFTTYHFKYFLKQNIIKHIRSAPYHLAMNWEAEQFIQAPKNSIKSFRHAFC